MNVSETKSKTVISFFLAIAIACAFFLLIMFSLPDSLYTMYENFFSQTLSEKEKIFSF
jgi:vesicle coat complex subunit